MRAIRACKPRRIKIIFNSMANMKKRKTYDEYVSQSERIEEEKKKKIEEYYSCSLVILLLMIDFVGLANYDMWNRQRGSLWIMSLYLYLFIYREEEDDYPQK